ncbi:putative 2-aminoethylphosphonate ABC transporter substrate-binding protein [Phreatobacter stygius]|uniref:Putative 2-aminoethylphosphonate ABC transporter substrate-binding protein n=1 Tax=Phreatobacter stygius TaxID=1940610 RepID=A0A4D7B6Y9_9HYPH|nr:putative 2-aminoethylphosphonate ABC transporter substrate-binding protein [Phreatobacter stygius]QCI66138.1 putative 2-aminoethylphosphonate ABC transporter substrate-binding protein [Phreatobacter stygius]
MKALLAVGFVLAMVFGTAAPAAAQKTRVTIYTALENEQLAPFKQAIEAAVPGVDVAWLRDSTGVITARFLAERERPQADMVMGLAASSLLMFEQANLLEAYTPRGVEALKPAFRDQAVPVTWTGMDAFLGVICFNTVEARKANVAVPATWRDLTVPALRGQIVMPHPASSGTGYLMVAMWLQLMGEEAGWRFMDQLHENVATYTHSGSAPCVQAARGERIAGISLDMRGARERTQGAPIEVVVPAEGTGWDMEAAAIVRGRPQAQTDAARRIMDWVATKGANELYARSYAVVAYPGITSAPANYPANAEARMFANDFGWMASNRTRVLAEWSRRYEAKAAARN